MTPTAVIFDTSTNRRAAIAQRVAATGLFARLLPCASPQEVLEQLERSSVDMIVFGTGRISKRNISWFQRLHCREGWQDIPTLVYVDSKDEDDRILAIEAGVSDCFGAETTERELRARIQRFLAGKQRLEALRQSNERLTRLAITDPLTGIGNRRHFDEMLVTEIKRGDRAQSPLTLMMVDIDHFKQVNDRIGHQGGDGLLRIVAGILRASIRTYDSVCRFGGEEFAIIMPGTTAATAYPVAERIRGEIAGINRHQTLGDFLLTVSIGMRCNHGSEFTTPQQLVAEADQALYRAKNLGRNRTEVFEPTDQCLLAAPPLRRFGSLAQALSV